MWLLVIGLYFVFGSASYLLRRILAQRIQEYNRLLTALFFVVFLIPAAIILASLFPYSLSVSSLDLLLLLGGSVIWPIVNLTAFKANETADAGTFVIISNLSPLFTLAIAIPFLNESLAMVQYVGIGLLVFSGVLATVSQRKSEGAVPLSGILWCLLSAALLGFASAYEGFMLSRVDFGTYLIYGWGAQAVWALLFAIPQFKKLPGFMYEVSSMPRTVFFWCLTNVLKSVAFIFALKLSGSASLTSAASNFLSVAVVIAAYIFLNERNLLVFKIISVAFGVGGLFLIAG